MRKILRYLTVALASCLFAACLYGCMGPDEETQEVIDKIQAIGSDVTLDRKDDVYAARNAYKKLDEDQQEKVSNYQTLVDAENRVTELRIEACEQAINDIGEVTLESQEKIDAAKKAYNALLEDEKKQVSNYETLKAAESKIEELEDAQMKADASPEEVARVKQAICLNPWIFMYSSLIGNIEFSENNTYTLSYRGAPPTNGTYRITNSFIECTNSYNGHVSYVPYSWEDDGKISVDFVEGFINGAE